MPTVKSLGKDAFHMTDFETRQPPYDSLTQSDRIKLQSTIFKIIRENTLLSVANAVAIDIYRNAQRTNTELKNHSAFIFCALQSFHSIAMHLDMENDTAPWACIFDRGDGHDSEFKELTDSILNTWRWKWFRMLNFRFGNKIQMSQIQAADVLAYEIGKEMVNNH